mmetsp:Transcript_25953/g.55803  ORF Transcript_25953/g.55803 Transcript_25953/m.55803 type:complete len:225 (-) Transcript_25953:948-1622(-)
MMLCCHGVVHGLFQWRDDGVGAIIVGCSLGVSYQFGLIVRVPHVFIVVLVHIGFFLVFAIAINARTQIGHQFQRQFMRSDDSFPIGYYIVQFLLQIILFLLFCIILVFSRIFFFIFFNKGHCFFLLLLIFFLLRRLNIHVNIILLFLLILFHLLILLHLLLPLGNVSCRFLSRIHLPHNFIFHICIVLDRGQLKGCRNHLIYQLFRRIITGIIGERIKDKGEQW